MAALALILAALLPAAARAQGADPFAAAIARRAGRTMQRVARVDGVVAGAPAAAVVLAADGGLESEVDVFVLRGAKAALVYFQPVSGAAELEPAAGISGFCDFFGDKAPALLYRTKNAALRQTVLHVLRWKAPYFTEAGSFEEGEVRDDDGRWLVLARRRPLGQFFRVGCGKYDTAPQHAVRTELWAWKGGKFVSVGAQKPGFFTERIAQDETELSAAAEDRADRPGDYLGKALTLYYDYESKGSAEAGWKRVSEALAEPPPHSPPGSGKCLAEVRQKLRAALRIPSGW